GREAGWLRRVAIPGFWFGAALLTKASALVFGPLCLFVVELEFLFSKEARCGRQLLVAGRRFVPALKTTIYNLHSAICNRDAIPIGGLGLLLAFLYCGSDWQAQPSFVEWARRLPDGPCNHALVWLADHLRLFSNAGEGLVRQIKHNVRGHGTYLLGEVADRAI